MEAGGIEARFGHPERAVPLLRRSLDVVDRTGQREFEAATLIRLAEAYRGMGKHELAIVSARKAAESADRLGSARDSSEARIELGRSCLARGRKGEAKRVFSEALRLADANGMDPSIVGARLGLAAVARDRGDLTEARQQLEAAMITLESLRRAVSDPELKSRFAGQNWGVYQDLIQVLSALERNAPGQGNALDALAVSERGRARAFLDMLAEARVDLSGQLSAEDRQRRIDLSSRLSRAYAEQRRHPSVVHTNSVADAERAVADWSRSLRYASPKYAELQYPEPLRAEAIERIASEQKVTILEFALGDPISHAWVIGPKSARMVVLPKRSNIEQAVREFRASLTHPPAGARDIDEFRAASAKLYSLLFARVRASELSRRLLIIPDGFLYYLPFEALVKNGNEGDPVYLNDAATISYAPSISVFAHELETDRAAKQRPRKELLAFGAPFFTGAPPDAATLVRSSYDRAGFSLSPLPSARLELKMLRALFPSYDTQIFIGAKATERAFKAERLTDYRLIHFASHAILDERFPQRSGIVLAPEKDGSEDGILRMNEIMNLRIDAALVVLSACQTGLGKVVRGEGLIGLTRAFMYAGGKQVAVSLWSVNDASTAEFMQLFYSELRSGVPAAEALRTARKRLAREYGSAYRHPYFWAPFVLIVTR
jgi:CHAT domain-containing protein